MYMFVCLSPISVKRLKIFFFVGPHMIPGEDLWRTRILHYIVTQDMIGTTSGESGERSESPPSPLPSWENPDRHRVATGHSAPQAIFGSGITRGQAEQKIVSDFFYIYLMTKCVVKNVQDLINMDEIFQVG